MGIDESAVDQVKARLRVVSDQSWADRLARGAHRSWMEAVAPIRAVAEEESITRELVQDAQEGISRLAEIVHEWGAPAVTDALMDDVRVAADALAEIGTTADPMRPQLPAVPPRTMGADFRTRTTTIRMRTDLTARIEAECELLKVPGQRAVDKTRFLHAGAMMVVERLEEARREGTTEKMDELRAYFFRY